MHFAWNENKRQANLAKHQIDFEDAIFVFASPHFVQKDIREDYGEDRFIATGFVSAALLVVVYTDRDDIRRIISARRGGRRDHERYKANFT